MFPSNLSNQQITKVLKLTSDDAVTSRKGLFSPTQAFRIAIAKTTTKLNLERSTAIREELRRDGGIRTEVPRPKVVRMGRYSNTLRHNSHSNLK